MSPARPAQHIRLAVFDWAGTTVDPGCFAPVGPFLEVFRAAGIELSVAEARGPMGLDKRAHIDSLLQLPSVRSQWKRLHDREPNDADVEQLYRKFVPLQLNSVKAASRLVPGLLPAIAELRRREIKIAGTTGYFQEAAALVVEAAREQGFAPDASICGSEVPSGRPAPWMIFRLMERLNVWPPASVVKIGDTIPDIEEGRNAGVWAVGVTSTGSDIGLLPQELEALPAAQRQSRLNAARQKLLAAGAHWVIETVAELPKLIVEIEERLDAGERP
jgi:phosphonoacetaldehyde hydrolase